MLTALTQHKKRHKREWFTARAPTRACNLDFQGSHFAADLDGNRVSHFDSKILAHESYTREPFTQSFNTCVMNC